MVVTLPLYILLLVLSVLVSSLVCAFFIRQILRISKRRNLYDVSDERKVHKGLVSRLGGVAFLPTMLIMLIPALLFTDYRTTEILQTSLWPYYFLIGIFIIYLVGLTDDLVNLGARYKLAVQILCALCLPFSGLLVNNFYGFLGVDELPLWLSWVITIFLPILLMNAYNLIDGIDGLSSGLALFAFAAFGVSFAVLGRPQYAAFSFIMVGIMLGFMYFNLMCSIESGKKIFMGDAGSLVIGFVMSFLCVKFSMNNEEVDPYRVNALIISYSLVLVPTFDVVRVTLYRLRKRTPIFRADKNHLHHRLMQMGLSQRQTLCVLLLTAFGFFLLNLLVFPCVGSTLTVLTDVLLWTGLNIYVAHRIKATTMAKA